MPPIMSQLTLIFVLLVVATANTIAKDFDNAWAPDIAQMIVFWSRADRQLPSESNAQEWASNCVEAFTPGG